MTGYNIGNIKENPNIMAIFFLKHLILQQIYLKFHPNSFEHLNLRIVDKFLHFKIKKIDSSS
jgi:hypothetical protein